MKPRPPQAPEEAATLAVAERLGQPRESLYWWAFVVAAAITPWLLFTSRRKEVLFLWITMLVAWVQMLVTRDTGGGAHHTILLWPLPLWLIATAFTAVSERLGRGGVVFLVLCGVTLTGSAVAVTNQYRAHLIRNGSPGVFSDAIFNLSTRIQAHPADRIYVMDWGMLENLRMLHRGKLPLFWGSEVVANAEPNTEDLARARRMFADPQGLFLAHADGKEVFPDGNARLRELAGRAGFERELLERIYDYNGRPLYEIFRYRKAAKVIPAPAR